MSETTQIVLAVGAVGLVGYLVLSKAASPVPKNTAPSNTATTWVNGIENAISLGIKAYQGSGSKSAPANAPLANIDRPLTLEQLSSAQEFRAEDTANMTDEERDAAIFG